MSRANRVRARPSQSRYRVKSRMKPSFLSKALRDVWAFVPSGGSLPEEVWRNRHRFLLGLTWFHAVVIALSGPVLGYSLELSLEALLREDTVVHTTAEGLIVALFAALAGRREASRKFQATAVGFGLMSSSAILVHLSGGYIEFHFHFFVMLAFLALYQDWIPYILAIVYVAIHHGLVGALWPEEVYNHTAAFNAPWTWASIHAFFVLWASVGSVVAWRFNEVAFTRQKQAEAKFRALAETANDAIVSADSHGNIAYFNKGAERIFGYSSEDVVGKPLTLLMPDRFHEAHRKGLARFFATGETRVIGRTVELAGRRRDGSEFPLELSLARWVTEEGTFFTGIVRDITRRKETEEEIRKLNEDLSRRAVELESTNRELEAFSYSVSHDLRAPLRGIDGFSHVLLEDYSGKLDAQGQDYLQRVRAATERMAQLIEDMLKLSRVTREEMHFEELDLSAMVKGIATKLRESQPERQVEFVIAEGLRDRGDERLLRMAFENLMENAWKFTSKHLRAKIEFGMTQKDGKGVYYVRDDGAGFDMTYADKLFSPFQRLHGRNEFPGTGIGLATVQRIIRRHGGSVWAEGEVEKGATFYFTLSRNWQDKEDSDGRQNHSAGGRQP